MISLESVSKRIIDFSKSDDFKGDFGDYSFEVVSKGIVCRFFVKKNFESIDSITYQTKLSGPVLGVFHALCKLLLKSNLERIRSFSFRELESYLRDSNQTPAMGEDDFPIEFIDEFKRRFLSAYLTFYLKDDIEEWRVAPGCSYVGKIKAIKEFLTLKVNMFSYFQGQNIEINLVHLGGEEVVIEFISTVNSLKLSPTSLSRDEILALGSLIGVIIDLDQINLVAE